MCEAARFGKVTLTSKATGDKEIRVDCAENGRIKKTHLLVREYSLIVKHEDLHTLNLGTSDFLQPNGARSVQCLQNVGAACPDDLLQLGLAKATKKDWYS